MPKDFRNQVDKAFKDMKKKNAGSKAPGQPKRVKLQQYFSNAVRKNIT